MSPTPVGPPQRLGGLPPRIVALAEAVAHASGRLLVVGGFVRDACLGRVARDLDLEICDLSQQRARGVLEAAGFEVREGVGKAFPVWLVRGGGLEPFEVSLPEPSDEADFAVRVTERARRRDLTINAMAYEPRTGCWYDAHGGMADLLARRLRAVDPGRFGEDPLRLVRVARFAASLGAWPDDALIACCRGLDLSSVPPERLHTELDRLLIERDPAAGLECLRLLGGLRWFPELDALVDVPQDLRWHPEGCVWTHTCMVVGEASQLRDAAAAASEADRRLMWAALLHDLGKPETTEVTADAIRSSGHDSRGGQLARAMLERLRAPEVRIAAVEALVRHHLAPAMLIRQASTDRGFRRLARRLGEAGVDAELLHRVARADHLGRTTEEALARSFVAGDEFLARMAALDTLVGPPPTLVRGRDVVAAGLAPGPEVGRVLERCAEIQDETGSQDAAAILEQALAEHRSEPVTRG